MAEPGIARVRISSDGYVHNTRFHVGDQELVLRKAVVTIDPADGVVYADVVLDELDLALDGVEARVVVGERDIHDVIGNALTDPIECEHDGGHDLCCAACRAKHVVDSLIAARAALAKPGG